MSERDKELAVLDAAHRYWIAMGRLCESEKNFRQADQELDTIETGRARARYESDRGSALHAATDLLEAVKEWRRE